MSMFKFIAASILLLAYNFSLGCLPDKKPSLNFEAYESIYLGQVVGVHLNEYQEQTLIALREGKEYASFPTTTPEYTVTVIPHRLYKGQAYEVETLKIFGCDVSVPETLQRGIFFIQPDKEVFVLYSHDYYSYEEYVSKASEYWRAQKLKLTIERGGIESKD